MDHGLHEEEDEGYVSTVVLVLAPLASSTWSSLEHEQDELANRSITTVPASQVAVVLSTPP